MNSDITYDLQRMELNNQLYEACGKKELDLELIKRLLNKGADPLGPTGEFDILEHLYGEIAGELCYDETEKLKNFPIITELFLNAGMDISKPLIPYDNANSINPLWEFAFAPCEETAVAMKMLLDNGLDADSVGAFIDHAIGDFFYLDGVNPNDEDCVINCTWVMKMIMLAASYPHILEVYPPLKEMIQTENNEYDLMNFRNLNAFTYEFDASTARLYFIGGTVRIYEKESKKLVWTMKV